MEVLEESYLELLYLARLDNSLHVEVVTLAQEGNPKLKSNADIWNLREIDLV